MSVLAHKAEYFIQALDKLSAGVSLGYENTAIYLDERIDKDWKVGDFPLNVLRFKGVCFEFLDDLTVISLRETDYIIRKYMSVNSIDHNWSGIPNKGWNINEVKIELLDNINYVFDSESNVISKK